MLKNVHGGMQLIANDKIHAIFRSLVEDIVSGKYSVGQRLPTDKELAGRFATSRINVFRALEQLKRLGLISSRKRAGTVVIAAPDTELSRQLLNDSSRVVYCLKSATPNFVHWNEETCTSLAKRLSRVRLKLQCLPLPTRREDLSRIITESMCSGAAGLIILPDSDDSDFLNVNSDLLVDVSTPILMLNRGNDTSRLDFVNSVNIDVMGDAIRMGVLLRKNGFRRMLIPGANYFHASNLWPRIRVVGLQLGFRGDGVSAPELTENTPDEIDLCLDRAQADPDLVIAAIHPAFARKILEAADRRNLKRATDFNLVCFDDDPAYADCQLTTTSIRKAELGDVIGKLLIETSRNPDNFVWNSVRVASAVVQRTSCRPLHM